MARPELPRGEVTFLFTDIEGSTRLIDELGEDGYVEALTDHRLLLRTAFAAHSGVEVDTQGDAFLYAFADAAAAVAAAAAGQEALERRPVKVRVGLHTAEPLLTAEGYAGRELHRAARIAASGHGGQVVVSTSTRSLVDGDFTALGEHRLKDFAEPVALFQLGNRAFPPLKTISNTNLPRPAASFVGRARERQELIDLLRNGTRLVTLSGPGGTGKTRLAVEVATELVPDFPGGVFWIGLATLRDPSLVTATAAQTLGAKDGLAEQIGDRELLLLLDNFEQVVEAAPDLGKLLERCPKLKLLVTSRELLRIGGEVDYPVPPLAQPEAVELFCTRARLEPDETVAELCRRLDDLPLALELAAARSSVLSPAQILDRISDRLDLLKGRRDSEARQETLRATIEWSYELLDDEQRRLFGRLAIFRGGSTLEAAEAVVDADLDTLQSLVDKSLVRHSDERFWMLETIRAFAREQLAASGDDADLRRRHALFALDYAAQVDEEIREGGQQARLFPLMEREQDNIRAALEWARDSGADEILLRLAAALASFWPGRGYYHEADMWFALALERGFSPVRARMKVLRAASIRAAGTRDYVRSDGYIHEWKELAEQAGDENELLLAMNSAALNASECGEVDRARTEFAAIRERAREIGDANLIAFATINLGAVAYQRGDARAAREYANAAIGLFRDLGDDSGIASAQGTSGWSSLALSDAASAEAAFREALRLAAKLGWKRGVAMNAAGLGAALVSRHQEGRAVQLFGAAASIFVELGAGFDNEHEDRVQEEAITQARAALGKKAFTDAWDRGKAMTPEDAVRIALHEVPA